MSGPDRLGKALMDFQSLRLKCCAPECGHEVRWTRRRAVAIFGENATPSAIRQAAKCSKCGAKNCDVSRSS